MSTLIHTERHGDVTVATLHRPPVNALNREARAQLLQAVQDFAADPAQRALVLCGRGALFSAGSDITEFSQGRQAPGMAEVLALIESSAKPVIAALHGRTLGGGFELALACQLRIGERGLRLGLPEVKLGLLPGVGGTQRLPRVIGPAAAVQLIASGREVDAEEALQLGLIEAVFDGDPAQAGLAHARALLQAGRAFPPPDAERRMAPSAAEQEAFETAAAELLRKARGTDAATAIVASVRTAMATPLADGLAEERRLFDALEQGEQSRALRHLFFAERAAARAPEAAQGQTPAPFEQAAVVGAGLMGGGIALCLLSAGLPTRLIDPAEASLQRARAFIEQQLQRYVASGRLSPAQAEAALARLQTGVDLQDAADADLVIEAAPETMALKESIFGTLGRVCRPGTLLATNTSSLDVNAIARASGRPQDVLGLHFFSPAHAMRLVEIVRGEHSTDAVVARALALVRRIGKLPATVGVCNGFVANRMMGKRTRQVDRLLLEGASPQEIDRATTGYGFPMGPLAVADLAGIDVAEKVRAARGESLPVAGALNAAGRHGQKTQAGYYRYEPGSRQPIADPAVDALIESVAQGLNVTRRRFTPEEILDRTLLPVVNEGVRLFEEGVAAHPADIDVILAHGYGWPAWRGGPMFWAQQRGLHEVCERLSQLAVELDDPSLAPAPLLLSLAASGGSLLKLPRKTWASAGRYQNPS
jgi:3-hydroxyacyl-CoA dehydrogenase